jgi:hypothetical protein
VTQPVGAVGVNEPVNFERRRLRKHPSTSPAPGSRCGWNTNQELAGHQDLSTTQRYMHLSPAAIEGAIRLWIAWQCHSFWRHCGDGRTVGSRTSKHWGFQIDLPANHLGPGSRRRAPSRTMKRPSRRGERAIERPRSGAPGRQPRREVGDDIVYAAKARIRAFASRALPPTEWTPWPYRGALSSSTIVERWRARREGSISSKWLGVSSTRRHPSR